jgi:hypothetical protein
MKKIMAGYRERFLFPSKRRCHTYRIPPLALALGIMEIPGEE